MYTYLALGDSYTAGESVPLYDGYPYQAVQLLRKEGMEITAPEIIAKTGWTTSELLLKLKNTFLSDTYDFVSLLIGVNNQYRGLPASQYAEELNKLAELCIQLVSGKPKRVAMLSIPDWSITPYARGKDVADIGGQIKNFNVINRTVSAEKRINYVDITTNSPENSNELSYLSGDGLHPSAKAYSRWAGLLAAVMLRNRN